MAMDFDDSLLNEYIVESREHLADIETDLLAMEAAGANIDEQLVNKVFRAAHSIKGGSGFFGLTRIQELAHKMENVLDLIRSREMVPAPDVINILLTAFDRLRELLNNHRESNQADISELVVALSGLTCAHLPPPQKSSVSKTVKVSAPGVNVQVDVTELDLNRAKQGGNYLYLVEYDLIHDVQRKGQTPLDLFKQLDGCGAVVEASFDLKSAGTLDDEPSNKLPFFILFATVADPDVSGGLFEVPAKQIHLIHAPASASAPLSQTVPAVETKSPPPPQPAQAPLSTAPSASSDIHGASGTEVKTDEKEPASGGNAAVVGGKGGGAPDATLRVAVNVLESLMNLAGELVLSRNQLLESLAKDDRRAVMAGAQRINLVTSELQEAIMLTRMQPIGTIFNKFPRVVRDLSKELGKDIRLEIFGREVEMDKTIVEGLSDPLTHMIRNSVDHGIETPEVRVKAGKSAAGTVKLKAYHEAGQVVIEINDNGKGIDAEAVAKSAINKGLFSAEQVKGMSEKEKTALIFLPGLSTAAKVTDVSGRGVGMDVVKTNLDRLGGKIEIETEVGKGSTFRIKLPLTLAIIPSLLVSAGGERFAVPQVNVGELIRISAEQVQKRIEVVGNAEVLTLRGTLIPLVRLADVLGLKRVYENPVAGDLKPERRERLADRRSPRSLVDQPAVTSQTTDADERRKTSGRRTNPSGALNIVVMNAGAMQYGLIVDQLHETVEIVVKPLGRHLKGLREFAGATIMGDGRVALILDSSGLAAKKGLISMAGSSRAKEIAGTSLAEKQTDVHSFLTFRNAAVEHCAVPLDLVARVEQIKPEQVEMVGGRRTMQYRGASLPLLGLKDAAAVSEPDSQSGLVVIVFHAFEREVGLLATMPVDVVETTVAVDANTLRQKGVMGSAVIGGHTTLIVDMFELAEAVHPEWAEGRERAAPRDGKSGPTILLAEDSDFFRNQVKKFLEAEGYKVLAAEDGLAAWELLQKNVGKVNLVLTDIEMPRLDGLGVTRNIRADSRFAGMPIIAITSLAGEDDQAKGKAAGVDDYQIKLDREKLLAGVKKLLERALVPA